MVSFDSHTRNDAFVCRVCHGTGLLVNETCPLCDGASTSESFASTYCDRVFFPKDGSGASCVLVAPNPILKKEWGVYVDILTSYSLNDCHPEQPRRFTVAMEEGILPNAMLAGSTILFPGDPAEFFQGKSAINEDLPNQNLKNSCASNGPTCDRCSKSLAVVVAVGSISDGADETRVQNSSARQHIGNDNSVQKTPPIQKALALAHHALFHELAFPDLQHEQIRLETMESSADANRHLENFAASVATWENFLKITTQRQGKDIVPDATEEFAKASWLAAEIVLSMAIRLTRGAHPAQDSDVNMKYDIQIKDNPNEHVPQCERIAKAQYGVAVVRPAGHHSGSTLQEFSLSAFCGLNHVMTAASYLANEGKRVLVIDLDAHFAKGSQQIALAVNSKLLRLGRQRILVSDISAALYQGEVAKEACKEGHLVFSTNPRGSTEVEAVAHANWFPPAHLKDGELNDAWLSFALLRTLAYCKESTFFANVGVDTTASDETGRSSQTGGPDVILVSFGLDAAKGEPDPEADCTCLGYAMAAEILKKHGVPVVFALEGGGYRHARDVNTMGHQVFPGLLENYEERFANRTAAMGDASKGTMFFEGAVEIGGLPVSLSDLVTEGCDQEGRARISIERRRPADVSVFGGNFQVFVRALAGHFEWGICDPAHELRNHVIELEKDISRLFLEERKVSPQEYMTVGEEVGTRIKEERDIIEVRGKQIQEAIAKIYKAGHLYVDAKPKKHDAEKSTSQSKRKVKT